jgi:large subunit ribosomal protein L4
MSTVTVYNLNKDTVGDVELPDTVFAVEMKSHLLHAMVRYQQAKRRAGTYVVKRRADVAGGGRKPFRQKGTGRARQGTTRAPQMRGGGVVFGPEPRSYAFKLNKKERTAALRCALTARAQEGAIVIVDELNLPEAKTRHVVDFLERFSLESAAVVTVDRNETVERSSRNLSSVTVLPVAGLNVYDILKRNHLVMTRAAVDAVVARLGE